jgi:cytochrome c nitrite reductase small subunit
MREHYDGWRKAGRHAFATCNDCHTPHDFVGKWLTKARNGFWHSKGFTLQDFHEPIQITPRNAAVLQANCVACHEGLVHDVVMLGSAGEPGNNCVRCHATVGHGPPR